MIADYCSIGRDKKSRKHIAREVEAFNAELNACGAASNQNDPTPKSHDVVDGVFLLMALLMERWHRSR